MYNEEIELLAKTAKKKTTFLNGNPLGYFLSAMLAGIFVGLGILLIFTIGGYVQDQPYVKILMGVSFGIALSLVMLAGAELFTGNNMIMVVGNIKKTATWGDTFKLWGWCWLGNLVGAVLLAFIFWGTGLTDGATGEFIAKSALAKMSVPIFPLFLRAVLCNILVCLAVWSSYRCKSESGKLIMIFWCLFAFITCNFEHSVANMTLLSVAVLAPSGVAVTFSGLVYNLVVVTLGNIVGGVLFMSVPYAIMARTKED